MMRTVFLALLVGGAGGLFGCGSGSLGPPAGTGGTGGGSVGAGGAVTSDAASCSSLLTPPVIPWQLVTPDAGAGTGVPADAGADAGSSGCTRTVDGVYATIACTGGAWLRADTDTPTITWDDGTQLVWNTTGWTQVISRPTASPGGQRVWASRIDTTHFFCSVCGSATAVTVEVRETQVGRPLFVAQSGYNLSDPSSEQLIGLFGVDADSRASCVFATEDGCLPYRLTVNDHVLRTTPTQVIVAGMPTTVSTANGRFDVIWYSGAEQKTSDVAICVDGAFRGPLMGFVASRAP